MSKKAKPYSGTIRRFSTETIVNQLMYESSLGEGAMRKDSVPLNNQVKNLFEQGLSYSSIRHGLGFRPKELKFKTFLKWIGARSHEEYLRKQRINKVRVRDKTGYAVNRKKAIKRDGGKCAVCGSVVGLNVHHIDLFAVSKNSQLDNLVTLCQWHHAAAHHNQNMFLFREFCLLAGEGNEVRYTKNDFRRVKQKARRHQFSKGVGFSTRAASVRERASRSLGRYMTHYKRYVNSRFPVAGTRSSLR